MNRRSVVLAAFGILLAGILGTTGAVAARTFCWSTAWNLWRACAIDSREELHVARARCANITDAGEREACREAADAAREEALEECGEQFDSRVEVCEILDEYRYDPDPLLDPEIEFVDPDDIPAVHAANPFVSLVSGHTYVLRAGEGFEEIVVVHVTDRQREIEGVPCRVVADVVVTAENGEGAEVEYAPVEVTDDWLAQSVFGDVYYCGELSRDYEDGVLRGLDGSFEAGRDLAKAGKLIAASPVAGEADRQEFAVGEAEDIVQYLDLAAVPGEEVGGENPAFPCAPPGCLETYEWTPLEPSAAEFKFYRAGVGFVLGVGLEDGEVTGERDELVCAGDSLDVLLDESCGIEDPEALLEALCKLSPDAFCAD